MDYQLYFTDEELMHFAKKFNQLPLSRQKYFEQVWESVCPFFSPAEFGNRLLTKQELLEAKYGKHMTKQRNQDNV